MRSSSGHRLLGLAVVLLAISVHPLRTQAQQQVQGFAVERLYPSAPGGGWVVMDALDIHGGLGGAMALTLGYARDPLRVPDGAQGLAVVSHQAFADIGAALTYDRWRVYLNLATPLAIFGQSGNAGGYSFTAPAVDLGSNPDTLSDVRIGLDVRILGGPRGRFRFGASGQLFVPSGNRADYDTDGTFRGMVRLLIGGDVGRFTYAGQFGVHVRPLAGPPVPEGPQGSELLFGAAAGARLSVGRTCRMAVIIGPEIYGATAFRAFGSASATALEALLSGRIEGTADRGFQVRVKLGAGAGINQHFGAPDWRLVLGVEVFNHNQRSPATSPAADGGLFWRVGTGLRDR